MDILPKQFEAAWEAFGEAVDSRRRRGDPRAVGDAPRSPMRSLARGTTLIHGDLRDENIALADGRLTVLDFGLATQGHPAAELAWYMVHDVWRIEASHDEVVEDFRRALGERDDPAGPRARPDQRPRAVRMDLRAQCGCATDPAEREWARTELNWWVPRVRHALEQWR